ncbi:MAG: M15 family metallopeptidase [Treponema sp.]|jgi:hypothetical protein|nr:M15 family metallopeptidase [Treponema sp.]
MTLPFALCLFLAVQTVFACGAQTVSRPVSRSFRDLDEVENAAPPSRAEQVMRALAAAYPRRIEQVEFRNDDWAVSMDGAWYYYAGGKLLPEELLKDAENYSSQPFYNYQSELPPWKEPSPEEAERFRNMANNRGRSPSRRSPQFFDDLWQVHNRDESYQRVKSLSLLGKSANVHHAILEDLSLVEKRILSLAKTSTEVQSWINGIDTLDGWSWRNIADTQTRSFHAYGAAVDILPKSLGGKETYWIWAARKRPEWWNISYSERFHPPVAVIKAFESYGFIWGGKWLFFDTMHFEYRPEIMILSGIKLESSR